MPARCGTPSRGGGRRFGVPRVHGPAARGENDRGGPTPAGAGGAAKEVVVRAAKIGGYRASDAPEIARLFYETVRSVNRADYSEEQVRAWAPRVPARGASTTS